MNIKKLSIVLAVVLVFGLAAVAFAQAAASITVSDQAVKDGSVLISNVVAAQDGFVVIHADANGAPAADIGHAPVKAGTTSDLVVKIDVTKATPKLYAMLHIDAGQIGVYEFPGADVPVQVNGKVVNVGFNVTGLTTSGAAQAATPTGTVTTTATITATTAATATAAATATTAPTAAATVTATAATTVTATRTAAPATLPTTGGGTSGLVVLLLGLGGLSLLAGLGLNLVRRTR